MTVFKLNIDVNLSSKDIYIISVEELEEDQQLSTKSTDFLTNELYCHNITIAIHGVCMAISFKQANYGNYNVTR